MASNKNALTRFHVLDKCFANPMKKYFIGDLIEACDQVLLEIDPNSNGIKRRQVLEDIKYMESTEGWSAPIDHCRDGKKVYYRYSDLNFSIDNQPLNQVELEQIKSAMQILSRFKGMPQFEWVNELAPKMEQSFLLEKGNQTIISFDNNQDLKGIEHLGKLFQSILYKRVLCISYQSFKSDRAKEYVFHPYYLKQYNNRWFVLGYYVELEKLTTFALDRITDISDSDIPYLQNEEYDFDEYFEDIVGVTRQENAEPEQIKLAFDLQIAPYVLSKPLHGTQKKVSLGDSELIISIEVIPNYELETLILSYGDRVRVLEPESFQSIIRTRLEKAVRLYC
ncbi:helix-turn-helix transcriptional regulator [Dyadobacter pollutisoli]|uniref:WYL domain-containing protein n=1 Tax=Dyadobacter pollutisoli TaxID=2910158 RepID=A0A9E8NAD7_9BACT|nr:WYL domain-containing protein [Dyadobacter pollutisoli]WAC12964.1 WYL domain-containing protein [Dyadobacter pollutisoli]